LIEFKPYLLKVVDKALLGGLKRLMTGERSHEVVNRSQVILLFNAKDRKLVKDLAFKGVNSLCSIIEAPAFFIDLSISFIVFFVRKSLGLVPR
jgi:hypothetical protein